jgi:hypothetical protein
MTIAVALTLPLVAASRARATAGDTPRLQAMICDIKPREIPALSARSA